MAARRLAEMADVVWRAVGSRSESEARTALAPLFGIEIDEIRAREAARLRSHPLNRALRGRDSAAVASAVGSTVPLKHTAADGH